MKNPIKIIDLFAGPGGLGEGFSAFREKGSPTPFKIALSIEKETSAHKTLQLRAFYRQFENGKAPNEYYDFLEHELGNDPSEQLYKIPKYRRQAEAAAKEAQKLTLGEDNQTINTRIKDALGKRPGNWVLIGGPPCQAYSLVGRSRNRGIKGYTPESDHRNFLYREYLKVIARFQPAVFVMENVKGMLSAKVGGETIFPKILNDLKCPARAVPSVKSGRTEYEIFSLTTEVENDNLQHSDHIIRAEKHGIPQARHRVILLGVRSDIAAKVTPGLLMNNRAPSIKDVISDLPKLRSGLSKGLDSYKNWSAAITQNIDAIIMAVEKQKLPAVAKLIFEYSRKIHKNRLERGTNWSGESISSPSINVGVDLQNWYLDPTGWNGVCNHETRGHITEDLHRYLFCACYSQAGTKTGVLSPKADEFPELLAPKHANWKSGNFADRFRVQSAKRFATTVTSHISKDGHYFIHYDPAQCRSLTVREAARIQTFPDNYFFVGNRTKQYVQVGNAVPPYLANQIAQIVSVLLNTA